MHTTQYAEYRLRRKCCGCGKQTPIGHVRCDACATKNQQRCVANYAARVQRGQCVKCPNQAEPHRVHCEACAAADRKRMRQQREGGMPPVPTAQESVTTSTQSRLWCCDHWIPIVTMPLRCLRCGRVHLARWPETKGTTA